MCDIELTLFKYNPPASLWGEPEESIFEILSLTLDLKTWSLFSLEDNADAKIVNLFFFFQFVFNK